MRHQLIINIESNSSLRVSEVSKYLQTNKSIHSYRIGIRRSFELTLNEQLERKRRDH